jgi:hypothetical protein
VSCSGTCEHKCTSNHPHTDWQDCECHHTEPDDEKSCCEHHKKDFVAPPDISGISQFVDHGIPSIPSFGVPSLGIPNFQVPGKPALPVFSISIGGGEVPDLEEPETVDRKELKYFERKENFKEGKYELPEFKYDDLYTELLDKFKDKFSLGWLDRLKNPSGYGVDLSWTIEFKWFNLHVGPYKCDVRKKINEFAATRESEIFRMILLVLLCIVFIMAILDLVFASR